ncbi:MAG TPA: hypothetical protein VLG11_05760 [Candidatus Saccharimonadales bacterium]|nr:hypothetical protein [Candidatus Saccharimonadales bacterium]
MKFIEQQLLPRERPKPSDPEYGAACHGLLAFTDSIIAKWVTIQQPDFEASVTGPVNNVASIKTPYMDGLSLEWRMSRAGLCRENQNNNPLVANVLVWRDVDKTGGDDEQQVRPLLEYRISATDVSYWSIMHNVRSSLDTPDINRLLGDLQDGAQQLNAQHRS